ncbi:HYDIN protein, partial [Pluvianellus socialis]|nr:HYDIN protein [Pluvianellus socialis]
VRVSAKAVFSKYSISPASLISFGAVMNGTRKTCTFTLENKGILDFKFSIYQAEQDALVLPRKSLSWDSLPQARFTLGMFTVYPGFGSIPPGGQQVVTVDCYAETLGTCEEHLSIDISDR